jgi:hypothetical protein
MRVTLAATAPATKRVLPDMQEVPQKIEAMVLLLHGDADHAVPDALAFVGGARRNASR